MSFRKTIMDLEEKVRALQLELSKYRAKAAVAAAAPTSKTPTWDKFQTLPEREKTAFWTQHREQLNAEQRAVAKKGGS